MIMSELKRHMSLFQLPMYGTGLILGTGIYVLIGEAASFAGNSVWIAFALGSVVAFITAGLGLAYGIISESIFSTLVFVILGTIFIGPILLRYSFKKMIKYQILINF